MLKEGTMVAVYDGDLFGWAFGMLTRHLGGDRWTIVTEDGIRLDRHVKDKYKDMVADGCGYVLGEELLIGEAQ